MALLGSATGVVKGVVELPIDIVKSSGREPVYRAEEDGPKNFVARLPNNAQRSSSPMISDALLYQPGAALNQKHPRKPEEHPSNIPRSHLSTSSSKSLTLTTVQGLGRIAKTTCAAPLAFTLGMTQGFRNAPALYGDTTVRPVTDVTG